MIRVVHFILIHPVHLKVIWMVHLKCRNQTMAQKKKVELTRLQGGIAIASFSSGVTIAAVCLFFIPPLGEIASSAVSIVSELLVLCGAILGVKASYDVKFRKFEAELRDVREHETQPTT